MAQAEELLAPQELIDYTKERKVKGTMGDVLFPERKTEAMEIKMIKGASELPVVASIHSFDVEAEIGSREGADYSLQDLALIKRKIRLSEKELIALESPRNSMEEEEMIRKIYSDVDHLVAAIRARIEAMRMEALYSGKISINENGIKASVDYGMPSNHKTTKNWKSGTPTILEDMDSCVNQIVKDTGFTPTRVLTSKMILNVILRDSTIRSAVFGVNSAKMLTVTELNAFLAQQSLPQIAIYDEMYRIQGKDGKYKSVRYLPEDAFVMMPDGKMGDTFYGLTAEELELRNQPDIDIKSIGTIIVAMYATFDPVAKWIKAVATAMPSFPYVDQVFSITVA